MNNGYGRTGAVPGGVAVGVTSVQVLGGNENRVGLILSGSAVSRVSYGFGFNAVLDQGLTLQPSASAVVLTRESVGDLVTLPLNAISSVANTLVSVTEILGVPGG